MTADKIVESVARALCRDATEGKISVEGAPYEALIDTIWRDWETAARAAIAAHTAALAAAGYVIVPREPTEAMLEAKNRIDLGAASDDIWPTMVAAAEIH